MSHVAGLVTARNWPVIRVLLEAPSTLREVSSRTGLPMAVVAEELDKLKHRGLLLEVGERFVGGYRERVYKITDKVVSISAFDLRNSLAIIERAVVRASASNKPGFFMLAMKRVEPELAQGVYQSLQELRKQLANLSEIDGEGGVLLGVAIAPWIEEES